MLTLFDLKVALALLLLVLTELLGLLALAILFERLEIVFD